VCSLTGGSRRLYNPGCDGWSAFDDVLLAKETLMAEAELVLGSRGTVRGMP
jgi:hypothetical protein